MRTPIAIPFWGRIKKLIRVKKISQEKLAAKINVSYGTLRYWICYGFLPDAETTCDLAEFLGVTAEYLVRGMDRRAMEKRGREALIRKSAAADIHKMARAIGKSAGVIRLLTGTIG